MPFIPYFVKPNHLTAFRMIATPFVLWLLLVQNYAVGIPVFILVACTDMLDGSLARVRNEITPWGIFFDPVADKLLIGSVAILVALKYFHPVLVFAAIILDVIPAIRWASTKHVGMAMMANRWGKTKMVLQVCSMSLLLFGIYLQLPILISVGEGALGLAIAFSVVAVLTYSL